MVPRTNSLIHFNFTTTEYNVGFSIERVGSFKRSGGKWEELNNEEVLRYAMYDSHLKQISGTVLVCKPGVYKAIWHNSFSYLKAKTLKYRLRVLEKKEDPLQATPLEDMFVVNDLSDREDQTFKALRTVYQDIIPMVRIVRGQRPPSQTE